MIVGIDVRHLAARQSGGIAEYTVHLVDALCEAFPATTFKLFSSGKSIPEILRRWENKNNIILKHIRLPNRFLDPALRFLKIPHIDRLLGGIDIFLSPHFLLSVLSSGCPRVLVIHDLSFVRFPELFSWRNRIWHSLMDPKSQALAATSIISVSEATKKDLINIWGISSDKVQTVYSGVDPLFMDNKPDNGVKESVRKKYNLPDDFILALSVIEPRKNYINLIKAFEVLKKEKPVLTQNIFLVIAGPLPASSRKTIIAAGKSVFKDKIIFAGFIDEQDKPLVYGLAKLFVYPSLFEGFGFPPLEAMARGIPTVVSNRSSLPEIIGEAAVSVDPYNISSLAQAMAQLLEDNTAREFFSQKGMDRAKEFNWKRTAEEIHRILEYTVQTSKNNFK